MADEEKQLDESMEMLFGALLRLDNEPENEGLSRMGQKRLLARIWSS